MWIHLDARENAQRQSTQRALLTARSTHRISHEDDWAGDGKVARPKGLSSRGSATAFLPTDDMSNKELADMDNSSDDDAIPATVMADAVANLVSLLVTDKREETIATLKQQATEYADLYDRTGQNPVVQVLRNIPPRRKQDVPDVKRMTSSDRVNLRMMERAFQKQVFRAVGKWKAAAVKGRSHLASNEDAASGHRMYDVDNQRDSPSKQSKESAFSLRDARALHQQKQQRKHMSMVYSGDQ